MSAPAAWAHGTFLTSAMLTLDPPHKNFSATHLPALRAYLRRAQRAVSLPGQVSVLLSNDRTLRRLNRDYRGKDKPTDVLSFPAAAFSGAQMQRSAGDLAISLDTAARQARVLGHSLATEIRILLLHGLLHLAGYDHETDRGEMAAREEALRKRFRLPTALIARTHH
jgi:probable rRNA maturation factor